MTWTTCLIPTLLSLAVFNPQAGVTIVAVVKVPEVSEKYDKTKDLERQFEQLRGDFAKERDTLKANIERATKSLQEEFKPNTDEFRNRRKEIAIMEAELQAFVELEGERLEQGLARSLKSIFDDIQAAVGDVAKEKGIDIVLASDDMPPEVPNSTQQVRQQIVLQKVLYWDPRVDITADVITKINAKYASAKPGDKPATPPAGGTAKPAHAPEKK